MKNKAHKKALSKPTLFGEDTAARIPVKNLFISSRMSLQRERDAAYHAVFDSGYTPLMFEREPNDVNSKRMMEVMLDASDVFVGIYEGDIGIASPNLYGHTPMEYEFWRFLTTKWLRKGNQALDSRSVHSIERWLEQGFKRLRADYIKQCLEEEGELFAIVESRVRFYRPHKLAMDRADAEFLRFLPKSCWREYGATTANSRPPFWRAYHDIYAIVSQRIRDAEGDKRWAKADVGLYDGRGREQEVHIVGSVNDTPGVLEALLRGCFQAGLDLRSIRLMPRVRPRVEFDLVGTPFHARMSTNGDAAPTYLQLITIELNYALKDFSTRGDSYEAKISTPEVRLATMHDEMDIRASHPTRSRPIMIRVPFANAPGALWEVVSRVSATRIGGQPVDVGRVTSVSSGQHREYREVAIEIRTPSNPDTQREVKGMLYQLHSAICVLGASMVVGEERGGATKTGPTFMIMPRHERARRKGGRQRGRRARPHSDRSSDLA